MSNPNNGALDNNNTTNTTAASQVRPPPVRWAQRADQVLLTIEIEDCKDPQIDLQKDKLHFKGHSGHIAGSGDENVTNEVTIEFHKPIKVEESKHAVKARGIEFVIIKEESKWWPRLLKDSTKQHWLKVDFPKWKDEDDSDDESAGGLGGMGGTPDFGDFMQQFGGGAGMPGMGDDEEFDGDDDEDDEDEANEAIPELSGE